MTADDVKFLGSDIHLEERLARGSIRFLFQKNDGEFTRFNSLSFCKRISRDDFAHLGDGMEEDAWAEPTLAIDARLQFVGENGGVALAGMKEDVAALQVRFDAGQLQAFAKRTKVVHFDFVVAADIHATQQANQDGHGESITRVGSQSGRDGDTRR